jgi:hypothetical protein
MRRGWRGSLPKRGGGGVDRWVTRQEEDQWGRRQVGDGGVTHCPNRVTGRVIGDPNR